MGDPLKQSLLYVRLSEEALVIDDRSVPESEAQDPFSLARLRSDVDELFRRFEIAERRSELLHELDLAILASTTSPEGALNLIIKKALPDLDATHGQLVVNRRNRLVVEASSEPSRVGSELPLEGSLCGRAFRTQKDVFIKDLAKLSRKDYMRFHAGTRSEVVLLIRPERTQQTLGLLALERNHKGPFDPNALRFARTLVGQVAIALEHVRIWRSVETLHHISSNLLSGGIQLEQAQQQILDGILDALNFEHGQVLRVDGRELVIVASSRHSDVGLVVNAENSVCGRYLLAEDGREILRIPEIAGSRWESYYLPLLGTSSARMRSEMIVPLMEAGHLVGALNVESPQPDAFSEFDEKLLGVVGELMVRALSATFTGFDRLSRERVRRATLTMTHLGVVAQNFIHRFGNDIGHVRGNLIELRDHIKQHGVGKIRKTHELPLFIDRLVDKLGDDAKILSDFSARFDPNKAKFDPKPMDLSAVAVEAVAKARRRLPPSAPIEIVLRDTRAAPEAGADGSIRRRSVCLLTEQVVDVVQNLVDNAVEAIMERLNTCGRSAPPGRLFVTVDVPKPLAVVLQVEDNGTGIAPEHRDKLFQFGFTTKRKTVTGGIGLWFCRLYAELLGGELTVDSREGQSIFTLQFPVHLERSHIPDVVEETR